MAHYNRLNDADVALRLMTAIEQRVVATLITAATGIAMGFLFVVQGVALLAVGIAEGLGALGVDGIGLDRVRNFGLAVQSSLDVVQSLSDCTTKWATGSDGLVLDPPAMGPGDSGQLGQAQSVRTEAAGRVLEAAGHATASDNLGTVGTMVDTANIMYTNMAGYFRDPAESWGAIVDIGGCMEDTGRASGDAFSNLYHS